MANLNYKQFYGEYITVTLNTGEKVFGQLTKCSDQYDYIELDGDSHTKKVIAKSQVAMIGKA